MEYIKGPIRVHPQGIVLLVLNNEDTPISNWTNGAKSDAADAINEHDKLIAQRDVLGDACKAQKRALVVLQAALVNNGVGLSRVERVVYQIALLTEQHALALVREGGTSE